MGEIHDRMNDAQWRMIPIHIAENVSGAVLEELPSLVKGYHVKCKVAGGNLHVVSLSQGIAHQTATTCVENLMNAWNLAPFFEILRGDAHALDGNSGFVPDLALAVQNKYVAPGEKSGPIGKQQMCFTELMPHVTVSWLQFLPAVIVEIEVSPRTVQEMRENFLTHFDAPALQSLVCIQLFGEGLVPHIRSLFLIVLFLQYVMLHRRLPSQKSRRGAVGARGRWRDRSRCCARLWYSTDHRLRPAPVCAEADTGSARGGRGPVGAEPLRPGAHGGCAVQLRSAPYS
jgi:hypothetical protein